MNKYELALIVNASVDEEARKATFDQVNELIARFGGKVVDAGKPEKKKLAYDIQKMDEGVYCFMKIDADAEFPAKLEERLRIQNNVLRYLIVKDGE